VYRSQNLAAAMLPDTPQFTALDSHMTESSLKYSGIVVGKMGDGEGQFSDTQF